MSFLGAARRAAQGSGRAAGRAAGDAGRARRPRGGAWPGQGTHAAAGRVPRPRAISDADKASLLRPARTSSSPPTGPGELRHRAAGGDGQRSTRSWPPTCPPSPTCCRPAPHTDGRWGDCSRSATRPRWRRPWSTCCQPPRAHANRARPAVRPTLRLVTGRSRGHRGLSGRPGIGRTGASAPVRGRAGRSAVTSARPACRSRCIALLVTGWRLSWVATRLDRAHARVERTLGGPRRRAGPAGAALRRGGRPARRGPGDARCWCAMRRPRRSSPDLAGHRIGNRRRATSVTPARARPGRCPASGWRSPDRVGWPAGCTTTRWSSARALRRRWLVRTFRLAGHAGEPRPFEMADDRRTSLAP